MYAPDFTSSTKSSTNLAGRTPALPGDVVEYTLTYVNTGQDPATGTVASDPIPTGTTYVPGSLQIVDGPGAGALSDASGDDRGEVVPLPPPDAPGGPAVPTVRVRLGTNPTTVAGGTIAAGATTTVKFRAIAGHRCRGHGHDGTRRRAERRDAAGGTCSPPSGQTVTCTIATLVAGATATMTVNATVPWRDHGRGP